MRPSSFDPRSQFGGVAAAKRREARGLVGVILLVLVGGTLFGCSCLNDPDATDPAKCGKNGGVCCAQGNPCGAASVCNSKNCCEALFCSATQPCPTGLTCEKNVCKVAPAPAPCVEGKSCSAVGAKGPCQKGKTTCVSGKETCQQMVFPQGETCNKLDDDCDGAVDDNIPAIQCMTNVSSCQPNFQAPGLATCKSGKMTCVAVVQKDYCTGCDTSGSPCGACFENPCPCEPNPNLVCNSVGKCGKTGGPDIPCWLPQGN